jgi:NADH dehydrogenase
LNQIRKHHRRQGAKFQISLVEAAPRILPVLSEDISRKVEKRLKQLGVKIYTDTAVKAETANKLQLPSGSIETHSVIWTAGVSTNPFFASQGELFKLGRGGRVEVGDDLQALPDVYVLGDSAATPRSGLAQTALYDADFVSVNLIAQQSGSKLSAYSPPAPVAAIPVGRNWCAIEAGSRKLSGYTGWTVRRALDFKLLSKLMPPRKASKVWRQGEVHEESCPICTGRPAKA